ncbi:MAG TPA: hypothetical protein PLQ56_20890 [Aggregatilineales bacterium]|nr:hypothetical protein [Anaerolineae bacterium]HUN09076.1 hypothetical protein [Aggregatilineales bacterium]
MDDIPAISFLDLPESARYGLCKAAMHKRIHGQLPSLRPGGNGFQFLDFVDSKVIHYLEMIGLLRRIDSDWFTITPSGQYIVDSVNKNCAYRLSWYLQDER